MMTVFWTKEARTETPLGHLVRCAGQADAPSPERHRAFAEIVRRFQDMAFASALAILGDAHLAEDAAQESFLTAWRQMDSLRDPEAFPGWFKQVVRSQCNRLIRNKRLPSISLEGSPVLYTLPAIDDTPERLVERDEQTALVRAALADLPERERLATILYYLDDCGQNEIATFLDVPTTTVKKRIYFARQRLRERMTPYMNDDTTLRDALQTTRPSHNEAFSRTVRLWAALDDNDADALTELLKADRALVSRTDSEGNTPLHRAAALGYEASVAVLLTYGANPNATRAADGVTPLHALAAGSARVEIAERLRLAGANLEALDTLGRTALRVAALGTLPNAGEADTWPLCEYLLSKGATVDVFTAALLDKTDRLPGDATKVTLQDADGKTPLHYAARAGWRQSMKALIGLGAEVNATDNSGRTPLRDAAEPGQARYVAPQRTAVTLLIEKGATVDWFTAALLNDTARIESLLKETPELLNRRDTDGATALCHAAWHGCRGVVEHLLEHGANVTLADNTGRSPLAVRYRAADVDAGIAELLLHAGAKPDAKMALVLGKPTLESATPDLIDWAIREGIGTDTIRALTANGSSLTLHQAATLGDVAILTGLLTTDPDAIRQRNDKRETALHCAAKTGHAGAVEVLLTYGVSVHATADDGATPLHRAAESGSAEIVQRLLSAGADVNRPDFKGETALFAAVTSGSLAAMEALLTAGASVNVVGSGKATPLHLAAEKGERGMVRRLITAGANVRAQNYWKGTPLHLAAREGQADTVHVLLQAGADKLARDEWYRTPLHVAVWFDRPEVVGVLLEAGIAVTELSYGFSTPLHTASERGSLRVAELLLKHGADPNAASDFGRTPLHDAVHGGHFDVVRLLIDSGANVSHANNRQQTPLHFAAAGGKVEIVRLLIERGADRAVRSHKEETPLETARRYKHTEVIRLLEARTLTP